MIELCYCANTKVFKGLMMSMVSAAENSSEPIRVTILTGDFTELNPAFLPVSEEERALLDRVLKTKNSANSVRLLDGAGLLKEALSTSKNMRTNYTPYTMLRLVIDRIPQLPDKLLYLDADTVVFKDLAPLYAVDLEGYYLGAVLDAYGRYYINPKYFNAGVILLNVPYLTQDHIFQKCLKDLATHRHLLPDQDVLNKYTRGKTFYLPAEYNEQKKLRPGTVIRHYSNQPIYRGIYFYVKRAKPWEIDRIHSVYKSIALDRLYGECSNYWEELGI